MLFQIFSKVVQKIKDWYNPPESPVSYWWTRFFFLKGLAFIYIIAFGAFCHQMEPLIGHNGILPVDLWMDRVFTAYAQKGEFPWTQVPTIFWFNCSNWFLYAVGFAGIFLAVLLLFGKYKGTSVREGLFVVRVKPQQLVP